MTSPVFQFTHPGKGATRSSFARYLLCCVSIHAPWEGCDFELEPVSRLMSTFQFTHPGKGATSCQPSPPRSSGCFNSRTLGRVRLSTPRGYIIGRLVSIHAPWEGCDLLVVLLLSLLTKFQFTHPGKGATRRVEHSYILRVMFQFTHPGKGATVSENEYGRIYYGFNSRTLGRVRRKKSEGVKTILSVSIHAPWEGCDLTSLCAFAIT